MLNDKNSFIFDFDSTLVTIEALDYIIKKSAKNATTIKEQVDKITNMAMNGELDFHESITKRFEIVKSNKKGFDELALLICDFITSGMDAVIDILKKHKQEIFIISAGFMDIVIPVADKLGIPRNNCYANSYTFNPESKIMSLNDSLLLYDGGKNKIIKSLTENKLLPGKVTMLGDGMSDCKTYLEGYVDNFIGCGFNVVRDKVRKNSPVFVKTIQELIEKILSI
jgi:HAD superfamily phosphoserine phosphatase-like hydrolase